MVLWDNSMMEGGGEEVYEKRDDSMKKEIETQEARQV